jgi:hypothetical protein
MSGDSNRQTQTSSSEPWDKAQPALSTALGDAQNIYKSGTAFQPYTGSTVVPYSQQTTQGMGNTMNLANRFSGANNPFAGALDTYSGMVQGGGFNDPQRQAMDQFRQTATSEFDPNANPAFQQVKQQAIDDASGAVNLGASASGRYGSGTHQGVMAKQIGDLSARMTGNEYDNWQGRRDAANTSLFNAGSQGAQQQLGFGGAMGGLFEDAQLPGQAQMGVGSMYEDLARRTMGDRLRIFNETRDAPLRATEWLSGIGSGAGSLGGQSRATAQGPGTNPFGAGLGGLLAMNSLFGGGGGGLFG